MSFLHKNKNAAIKQYTDFLNEADIEYMRAFSTRSLKALYNYMSRECVNKLSVQIYADSGRYFGAPKFRKTTWSVIAENQGVYDVCKDVVFDKIRFTRTIKMSVAQDYKELWRIDTRTKPCIIKISKLV